MQNKKSQKKSTVKLDKVWAYMIKKIEKEDRIRQKEIDKRAAIKKLSRML